MAPRRQPNRLPFSSFFSGTHNGSPLEQQQLRQRRHRLSLDTIPHTHRIEAIGSILLLLLLLLCRQCVFPFVFFLLLLLTDSK